MTDSAPMSDEEFLLYCRTHCLSSRAAFVPAQIARLLRLHGDEELAAQWDSLPNMIIDGYKYKVLKLLEEIEAKKAISK